jgi:hypothetical protein
MLIGCARKRPIISVSLLAALRHNYPEASVEPASAQTRDPCRAAAGSCATARVAVPIPLRPIPDTARSLGCIRPGKCRIEG